jgi:hypothetical protein
VAQRQGAASRMSVAGDTEGLAETFNAAPIFTACDNASRKALHIQGCQRRFLG